MPTRFGVSVKERVGLPVVATTCGADVMLLPQSGHGDRLRPWVDRLVRGCAPNPGAWTTFRGERLKLAGPVTLVTGSSELAPGELAVTKRSVRVGTGSHEIELGEVQPQGKKQMRAADWARGVRIEPGERLGD